MRLTALFVITLPLAAQDVGQVFAANCAGCHAGPSAMGGLSLSSQDSVLKGGKHGPAVLPGRPEESRLYLMVTGKLKPQMPIGGQALATGDVETIRKWIETGAPAFTIQPHPSASAIKPRGPVKPLIYSLAERSDGTVAVGGYREVRLRPGDRVFKGASDAVRAVAFSPDGKLIAAAGGLPARKGEVQLWNVETGQLVRTLSGHGDCVYAVAFTPDGSKVATASYDKLIKLWDVGNGTEIRTLKDHIDAVYALAFTPGGKRLVSGAADRTVKIWDIATGERLYTLGDPADGINTLALDPTGKYVAGAGLDKSIRIWELGQSSGTLLRSVMAHEDAILRIAWSPDGQYLISTAADKSLKAFRASDLSEVKTFPTQSDWVYGLAFEPDGRKFIAGRFDGSIAEYSL